MLGRLRDVCHPRGRRQRLWVILLATIFTLHNEWTSSFPSGVVPVPILKQNFYPRLKEE